MTSLMDSPFSQPQIVGYDAFGRPVYNRNARQKQIGLDGSLSGGSVGDFGFGGPTTATTMQGGGMNPLSMAQSGLGAIKTGKDAYSLGSELFGGGSSAAGGGFGGGVPMSFEDNVAFADNLAPMSFEENLGFGGVDSLSALSGGGTPFYGTGGGFGGGLGGVGQGGGGAAAYGVGGSEGAAASTAGALNPALYGAAGMAAMLAIMQLGGAFDPTTPTQGVGGTGNIGSSGKFDPYDLSSVGTIQATPQHFAEANRLRDALANVDLTPWAGNQLFTGYGSDKDYGLDRPRYDAQLLNINGGANSPLAGRYAVIGSDPNKVAENFAKLAALGPGGAGGLPEADLLRLLNPDWSPEDLAAQLSVRRVEDR